MLRTWEYALMDERVLRNVHDGQKDTDNGQQTATTLATARAPARSYTQHNNGRDTMTQTQRNLKSRYGLLDSAIHRPIIASTIAEINGTRGTFCE